MGDKLKLNVLVFEDDAEQREILISKIKITGFDTNILFIDPVDYYDAQNDSFDNGRFLETINEKIKGNYVHLIASDWNLFDKTEKCTAIKGIDIIETMLSINLKFSKVQYLLYSSNVDEASKIILERIKENIDSRESDEIATINLLKLIFTARIKFIKRGPHFNEIIQLLKDEKSISSVVLNSLENFDETMVVNTGNGNLDGRKISHFLELIQKNEIGGLKFIKEFTELAIANYTELNA
ncbi:hypothetical protein [Flavobacterium yafengii]|uniref:hypothetical protein n=1 Tax=Flavobacterium yafengii TaxID=3041253 RepID=UPI0024A7C51F|nr:hypothetical protein [Flavobacterium yafengii]MDI6047025.1 hypothetical protein [Flavobacterium yafengii]